MQQVTVSELADPCVTSGRGRYTRTAPRGASSERARPHTAHRDIQTSSTALSQRAKRIYLILSSLATSEIIPN
jgi:hypothetical protein